MNRLVIFRGGANTSGRVPHYLDLDTLQWTAYGTGTEPPVGQPTSGTFNARIQGAFDGSGGWVLMGNPAKLYRHNPATGAFTGPMAGGTDLSMLYTTIRSPALASDGDHVYLLGGDSGSATLYVYTVADDSLRAVAVPWPGWAPEFYSLCWDGLETLYMAFGNDGATGQYRVYSFHLGTEAFTDLEPGSSLFSGGPSCPVAAYAGGKFYVVIAGNMRAWDPETGTWSAELADPPSSLGEGAGFAISDREIVVIKPVGFGSPFSASTYRIDTDAWATLPGDSTGFGSDDGCWYYWTVPLGDLYIWRDAAGTAFTPGGNLGSIEPGAEALLPLQLEAIIPLSGVVVNAPPDTADMTYDVSPDGETWGPGAALGDFDPGEVKNFWLRAQCSTGATPGLVSFLLSATHA